MAELVQPEVCFGELVGGEVLSLRVFLNLHLDQVSFVPSLNESNLNHAPTEPSGSLYAPVAGNEFVLVVYDHRIQESVPTKALHQ